MEIQIKETGEIKTLSIIDPKTGTNYAADFVGNNWTGTERDDEGRTVMTQDDYEWWQQRISDEESTDELIAEYREKYGDDDVDWLLEHAVDHTDFSELPHSVRFALAQLDK